MRVRVVASDASVVVEVSDDGVGGADPAAGSGLRGLADRVEALGGYARSREPRRRRDVAAGRDPGRPGRLTAPALVDLDDRLGGPAVAIDDLDRLERSVLAHAGEWVDDHAPLIGVSEQEVACCGPRARARLLEVARRLGPQLPGRAAHHVVDAVDDRVLEVVLVPAEHEADAGLPEQRYEPLHHPRRVGVLRPGAERRMVRERDPPARAVPAQRLLDPSAVRGIVEVVLDVHAGRDRRVDADELHVRADLEAIEEAGAERRRSGLDLGAEAMIEEEVVDELVAIVRALAVAGVVVADGREERDAVEDVPIRLVEARVPLVVLVARAGGVLVPEVDVVACRDHEPHVARVDRALQRACELQLPDAVEAAVEDPDAEVAEHGERHRRGGVGRRERAEAVVVPAARADQRRLLDAPVAQFPLTPRPAVDAHAIAVLGVGLESGDPDVVVLLGLRPRNDPTVALDLDDGVPERLRAGADRLGARRGSDRGELLVVDDPPLAIRRVALPEVEPAPGDQGLVVTEAGEVQELLEVDLELRHLPGLPTIALELPRDAGSQPHRRRPLREPAALLGPGPGARCRQRRLTASGVILREPGQRLLQ